MFDSLKQEPRGLSSRHRRRMVVSIGAALALGGIVYTGGSTFVPDGPREFPVARSKNPSTGPTRELDRTRLSSLAEGAATPSAINADALRYVLGEVARDRSLRALRPDAREDLIHRVAERAKAAHEPFDRAHYLPLANDDVTRLDPAKASALPAFSAGRYVEVRGVVRDDDGKAFTIPGLGDAPVYGCTIEGKDGSRVVVIDSDVIRDRRPAPIDVPPADAEPVLPAAPRARFDDGQLIRARGYFLQPFAGRLGSISTAAPIAVLVGRDYRPSIDPPAPPKSLVEVASSDGDDRVLEETWSVDTLAHFVALHWAESKGHEALLAELSSGALRWLPWERAQFLRWSADLERSATETPDPRKFTNDARGRVFRLAGVLVSADLEDWDTIEDNAFDVGRRWVYRLISDDYGQDAMIRFDSPFPLSEFPGVRFPDRKQPQRVRLYGVFLRNHSYVPKAADEGSEAAAAHGEHHVTVPEFVALHIAPDPIRPSAPLLENPFFWSWVGLLLFALVFFGVMRPIDKREEARHQERERRVRQHIPGVIAARKVKADRAVRDAGAPGAPNGVPPPDPTP